MDDAAPLCALFFGDSLVAGTGDPAGGGWVARVLSACFAQGPPLTAYNLGIRGETSVQVAARWQAEATPRMLPGAEHRLVVSFGANDTTVEEGAVRVAADESRRALTTMLDQASALGFTAFVVGPAPLNDADQDQRMADLTTSFAEVCHERETPFIGVLEPLLESPVWVSEVGAGDGAHPGAAGYDTLAQLLLDGGLLAWLADAATGREGPLPH